MTTPTTTEGMGEITNVDQCEVPHIKWQTIATAPVDGTVILGRLPDSDIPQSIVFRNGAWLVQWDESRLSKFDQPTHWISLKNL